MGYRVAISGTVVESKKDRYRDRPEYRTQIIDLEQDLLVIINPKTGVAFRLVFDNGVPSFIPE